MGFSIHKVIKIIDLDSIPATYFSQHLVFDRRQKGHSVVSQVCLRIKKTIPFKSIQGIIHMSQQVFVYYLLNLIYMCQVVGKRYFLF
jgi:hypothetical protein